MELLRSPTEAFEEEKILLPPLANLTLEYSHPAYVWFDRWQARGDTEASLEQIHEYALEFAEARDYAHLNIVVEEFPGVKTEELLVMVLLNGDTEEFLLLTQASLRPYYPGPRMEYWFRNVPNPHNFGLSYVTAAIQGNVDPLLIKSLTNYNFESDYPRILEAAIQHGIPATLDLVVNLVSPGDISMANRGLKVAARAANLNLVKEFVARGANDWNRATLAAITGRSPEVINYLIEQGANNYDAMLAEAIYHYPEIAPMLSATGKITPNGWYHALIAAAAEGYLDWVQVILPSIERCLGEVLLAAVRNDRVEVARYLLTQYPRRISEELWERARQRAIAKRNPRMIGLFLFPS